MLPILWGCRYVPIWGHFDHGRVLVKPTGNLDLLVSYHTWLWAKISGRREVQSCPQAHLRNVNVLYLFSEDDITLEIKGLGSGEKLTH